MQQNVALGNRPEKYVRKHYSWKIGQKNMRENIDLGKYYKILRQIQIQEIFSHRRRHTSASSLPVAWKV